jgi:hypothetical protein
MSSTLRVNTREYYEILKTANFIPASYLEIAESLMKNGIREMYHALVNENDIDTLFSIPNLKIFWVCRCHHIADDGSTAHEHLHALVQYQNKKTHRAFKDRLKRSDQLLNPKTTFKKILCPDHVVGVLRYITCRDGQRATRRNADGLMGAPHTHYKRSVFGRNLLHRRNRKQILGCKDVRRTILRGVSIKLSEEWKSKHVSGHSHHLHHHETCQCEFGKIGRKKKKEANEKRRAFYKTERGQTIKNRYKETAKLRNELIEKLMAHKSGTNLAEIEKETILKLLRKMQ